MLSSATSTRRRSRWRRRSPPAPCRPAVGGPGADRRTSTTIAATSAACRTGLVRCAPDPARGSARDRRAGDPRSASPPSTRSSLVARCASSTSVKPSMPGMWTSTSRTGRRRAAAAAASIAASASAPLPASVGSTPHEPQQFVQDAAVGGVVVHDQHAQRRADSRRDHGRRDCRSRLAATPTRHGEAERAAAARAARRAAIVPPISATRRRRDRQAQAGAAVPARHRAVGLRERLEDQRLLVARDADAGVADRERAGRTPSRSPAIGSASATSTDDLAALGELDGVADQVQQHLAQALGVADDAVGHVRRDAPRQLEPLLCARTAEHLHGVAEHLAERRTDAGSSSSLPASIFEKSRMSLMMRSSASADDLTMPRYCALLGIVRRLEQQLGHAEHAVHRGADLVAHVGQELALGAVGRLGRVLRQPELLRLLPHAAAQRRNPGQRQRGQRRRAPPSTQSTWLPVNQGGASMTRDGRRRRQQEAELARHEPVRLARRPGSTTRRSARRGCRSPSAAAAPSGARSRCAVNVVPSPSSTSTSSAGVDDALQHAARAASPARRPGCRAAHRSQSSSTGWGDSPRADAPQRRRPRAAGCRRRSPESRRRRRDRRAAPSRRARCALRASRPRRAGRRPMRRASTTTPRSRTSRPARSAEVNSSSPLDRGHAAAGRDRRRRGASTVISSAVGTNSCTPIIWRLVVEARARPRPSRARPRRRRARPAASARRSPATNAGMRSRALIISSARWCLSSRPIDRTTPEISTNWLSSRPDSSWSSVTRAGAGRGPRPRDREAVGGDRPARTLRDRSRRRSRPTSPGRHGGIGCSSPRVKTKMPAVPSWTNSTDQPASYTMTRAVSFT